MQSGRCSAVVHNAWENGSLWVAFVGGVDFAVTPPAMVRLVLDPIWLWAPRLCSRSAPTSLRRRDDLRLSRSPSVSYVADASENPSVAETAARLGVGSPLGRSW